LAKIEVINTHYQIDLTGVKMSGHEYNQNDVGLKFEMICDDAVEDFRQGFIDENVETALIFVPNCSAGKRVINCWNDSNTMRMVSNESSDYERKEAVEWFKYGKGSRYLVNVNIYTTGFNFPALQAVVMLRATTSPGLLIQILGRLIRPYGDMVGKFWDYGSNLSRLGGIEDIIVPKPKKRRSEAPKKPCTAIIETPIMYEGLNYRVGATCGYPNLLSAKKCKVCDAEFIPMGEEGKYAMKTKGEALALKKAKITISYDVKDVFFDLVNSKKGDIPMVKLAFYDLDGGHIANSYLCFDHSGQAKNLATARLMELLKDKKSYYQIRKFENGVTSKSIHFLTGEEYYDQFLNVSKP
jgi:DNA or RNA helicases of superfamily II